MSGEENRNQISLKTSAPLKLVGGISSEMEI